MRSVRRRRCLVGVEVRCVQRSGVLLCCLVQLCHLEGFLKRQFRHLEQAALHVVVSDSASQPVSDEFLSRISVLAVRSQVSQTCHKYCHARAVSPYCRTHVLKRNLRMMTDGCGWWWSWTSFTSSSNVLDVKSSGDTSVFSNL